VEQDLAERRLGDVQHPRCGGHGARAHDGDEHFELSGPHCHSIGKAYGSCPNPSLTQCRGADKIGVFKGSSAPHKE